MHSPPQLQIKSLLDLTSIFANLVPSLFHYFIHYFYKAWYSHLQYLLKVSYIVGYNKKLIWYFQASNRNFRQQLCISTVTRGVLRSNGSQLVQPAFLDAM